MKNLLASALFALTVMLSPAALTAEVTIKLSVPGMNCPSCPYMVKQAILMVDGIKTVDATMKDRSATVTFDDTVASVEAIQEATADIGYPSSLFKKESGS